MATKINIASVTILVADRHKNITKVNKVLTDNGYLVLARLGVTVERHCLKGCTGVISLIVEGTKTEITSFTKKLNSLVGVKAKNTNM